MEVIPIWGGLLIAVIILLLVNVVLILWSSRTQKNKLDAIHILVNGNMTAARAEIALLTERLSHVAGTPEQTASQSEPAPQ